MRIILLLLCLQPALLLAAPRVVVSIVPLQEIAAAVMSGVGEPSVIIEGGASAHHFAFRPSHMERLQQADLVIWVDRHFESGFSRIPAILPASTATLELVPALGIGGSDGHFWYAPELSRKSVELIADKLVSIDPAHQAQYRANAESLVEEIRSWRQRVHARWQRETPRILTAHDFLRLFASDLKLFEIESIYDRHDARGGLKDLRRLEAWLRETPPSCLLTMERDLPALAASLADKYRLRVVRLLDRPATPVGKDAFPRRLARLESAIERCAGDG